MLAFWQLHDVQPRKGLQDGVRNTHGRREIATLSGQMNGNTGFHDRLQRTLQEPVTTCFVPRSLHEACQKEEYRYTVSMRSETTAVLNGTQVAPTPGQTKGSVVYAPATPQDLCDERYQGEGKHIPRRTIFTVFSGCSCVYKYSGAWVLWHCNSTQTPWRPASLCMEATACRSCGEADHRTGFCR